MSAAAEALVRSLSEGLPFPVSVERSASREWASAGALGERQRIELSMTGSAARTLLEGLGEREFDLGDQILADVAAVADERESGKARLVIEALTIAND